MDRKEFLKTGIVATLGLIASKYTRISETPSVAAESSSEIFISKNGSPEEMTFRVVKAMGAINKFVKKGSKVVIKPNIAWNRTPEQAATTHPEVVGALVKMCRNAGASSIIVTDVTCNPWQTTFVTTGIKDAVENAGGTMRAPEKFRTVSIPNGAVLKEASILEDILDADVLVNVPVAKVHGSQARITISMKNWMGAVRDRGFFHRTDLNQCIVDISSFLKPAFTIVDATRILLTRGPQGPGEVKETRTVCGGLDFVALDAYGATLLGVNPSEVRHLQIAEKMGLGIADLSKVKLTYV
ncbi:MAG: DUF362 domain-containing protein [Candidatus Omnitrophica bacterium]|nr:DUF362 domain-containing protein [Candidatus Omnitrophota bacterium]MCM8828026.1 DUF362 domain-containing protein [Candidatus Omnitrophota bacterium]